MGFDCPCEELDLKYLRFTTTDCKDIEIRKSKFVIIPLKCFSCSGTNYENEFNRISLGGST